MLSSVFEVKYGNVEIMSASATLLSRIDSTKNIAAKLCCELSVSLQHHHYAAAVELLLKLLDGRYRELLQTFCSVFLLYNLHSYCNSIIKASY